MMRRLDLPRLQRKMDEEPVLIGLLVAAIISVITLSGYAGGMW